MRTTLIVMLLATMIQAETLPSPDRFVVQLSEPVTLTSWNRCAEGYCFKFSNGGVINETFAQYAKRTGKLPREAAFQCSTGYCGTPARVPTLATGGCRCGCNAATCSCAHSPNVGKPLSRQTYKPGRLVGLNNHVQWR